jgi:hypothetical protein
MNGVEVVFDEVNVNWSRKTIVAMPPLPSATVGWIGTHHCC